MKRASILALALLGAAIYPALGRADSKCDREGSLPCDVTLGHPRVWGYERLYPLLDGLFQDVSSTQIAQLTLNPNAANAASLDAVQNAFQLGVSFSQTTGANNAVAQQLNSVLTTNASLQNELLSRQAQLVQSALVAQQQVGSAQALVDQLKQSPTATPDQVTAAAQALTAANDNLTTITNQLTLVKGQVASSLGSVQTLQAPSTSAQSSPPTLPSGLLGLTAPPNGPQSPSFPSSKQMDNQINLLWERLSRLTSTLAEPDSMKGYVIDLVEFNVGVTPLDRKHKLLGVEYGITCNAGSPIALDLFPSASTVNIVDTKYRENRVGLAAFISWFSVGVNAAYNRDHLRMTQSLGQSGYITGFGEGTAKFGWIFGRNLGDDTLTPGERTVFALVAVPATCKELGVSAIKAGWFDADSDHWYSEERKRLLTAQADSFCPASGQPAGAGCKDPQPADADNQIVDITYAPADFDPTAPAKSLVSLEIHTSQAIDPQQIISINGKIIKRSRDSFGRAVGAGGSGGLLETTTVDPNSWLPSGSERFTLTLDPSAFGRRFPDIEIESPSGNLAVKRWLKAKGATVHLAGRDFDCRDSCITDLPALGYAKGTTKQLLLSQLDSRGTTPDTLLITVLGEQATNPSGSTSASGVPTLQVFSQSDQATWGGDSVVLATFVNDGKAEQKTYRLTCHPLSSRLACAPPPGHPSFTEPFTILVIDPDHSGGPITGSQSYQCDSKVTRAAGSCSRPLVWQVDQPRWEGATNHLQLKLHLELANVADGEDLELIGNTNNPMADGKCAHNHKTTCGVDLIIPEDQFANVTDQMVLRFVGPAGAHIPTATLGFLHTNAEPLVTGLNSDQTLMTGQNLRFATLLVGDSGTSIALTCHPNGSQCFIPAKTDPKTNKPVNPYGNAQGFLFFKDDHVVLDALQIKAGVISPISHTAPTPGGNGGNPSATGNAPQISISIQNQLQEKALPKLFVAQ